ncbi:spore germination protein [Tissierella pigra]|uniref:GerAB/ArcD/ProY family transporter n=1 Tax=Tissierella pigra TaxID=2607614 RepID=A0A6N7XWT2_9FIRM|nr:endospore germination permease [Tissierella pigra]MBU5427469.1 spore germination protein [Tissierella pigra]MSU01014.1 GerAB/ArcD/ProY family transporter [Tissierella pigra]
MENTKINKVSYNQVLLLIVLYRIMVGLTYMPAVNTTPANQDVWIATLLSIFYTILFNLPIIYLSNKFNKLNLLEITEKIMGKFLGKIIGVIYFITFLFSNIIFVGTLVEILNTALFPVTPTWFTTLIIMLTCAYISSRGLRNIGRLGEIIVPIVIFTIFLIIILGYKNYNIKELLPVFSDSTFGQINLGAINTSMKFFDILVLVMITPNLENKKDLNRIFVKSIVYSILIVVGCIIPTQMTVGIELAKHMNFPFLTFTRMIQIGEIQGFDLLYMICWIMGNTTKISGYLYFTTITLGEIANKKNQIFIIPISIIMFVLVTILKDSRSILGVPQPANTVISVVSITSIIVIPSVMLIVYFFRKKRLN